MSVLLQLSSDSANALQQVASLPDGRVFSADVASATYDLELDGGKRVLLFGDVFYHLTETGATMIAPDDVDALSGIFGRESLTSVVSRLEGQYVGVLVDPALPGVRLFSDRYARLDTFWAEEGGSLWLSDDLSDIFANVKPVHDQKMIAHMFQVYGWYTPKGLTMYSNAKQLKVGEIVTVSAAGIDSETIEFDGLPILEHSDAMLERYFEVLRASVRARAARGEKTWVSSSSGWDSSMLLAMLVNEFGAENVGMLTGSMRYSADTDVINAFEIEKIKKIGGFYGITPEIVDLDFLSPSATDTWAGVLPYYRGKHMYSATTHSFSLLSNKLTEAAGPGATIFNGETSDSFHNFGFSQFVTFFHTVKAFTEYGDKMNCYLYGPSFFKKVMDGSWSKDKVAQIFQKMNGIELTAPAGDRSDIIEAFLYPLFYGGPRLPFAKTSVNPALNAGGQDALYRFPFREYAPQVLDKMTEENLYSWYIHLYHSFHSQGATVNTQKHAMTMNGHKWRQPFNDLQMVQTLSQAPESWGRGLDFNHTKFPLKWVAQNKIRFPYEVLDEGAHSYLYDVIEGFSLFAEIMYRSGVTSGFRGALSERKYRDLISDEYMDVSYLDGLVDGYLNGQEVRGADFNNLITLATLSVTGWYE